MASLFPDDLPAGFRYEDAFLTREEEATLLEDVRGVAFANFEMRGVIARRRVAFFGASYDASRPTSPMPAFLEPLRERTAVWAGVTPEAFAMALINEYRPGAPIGWHRDAPHSAGWRPVSSAPGAGGPLGRASATRGAGRAAAPHAGPHEPATHEIELPPRSAYVIAGEARRDYEHSIPPVDALRYSITFRTLR